MKILLLDIETAPNTVYTWGLYDQNIAHNQIVETSSLLCWSAKWFHEKEVRFASCKLGSKRDPAGYREMVQGLHGLLDEADVVVHYYGSRFDIPKSFKEFVQLGMPPPSPFKQIDLKITVQRVFKFESNKLDHVGEMILGTKKIKTEFDLWVKCMHGESRAWAYMERYNRHDVVILEKLYRRLIPWIDKHPSWGAMKGGLVCPKCGSSRYQSRGTQVASTAVYTRYHCQGCGAWFRDNKSLNRGGVKGVNIVT